ncbi:MAG: hypothetical protein KC440_06645 [Nitrosarchaeum sp.]|nr:hypothetical protein [Nitrosarchaeum sp.]
MSYIQSALQRLARKCPINEKIKSKSIKIDITIATEKQGIIGSPYTRQNLDRR